MHALLDRRPVSNLHRFKTGMRFSAELVTCNVGDAIRSAVTATNPGGSQQGGFDGNGGRRAARAYQSVLPVTG
jgi:hypothetical protein